MANTLNIGFTTIALLLLITFIRYEKFTYLIIPVLIFWGFQDAGINTIMNTILGF